MHPSPHSMVTPILHVIAAFVAVSYCGYWWWLLFSNAALSLYAPSLSPLSANIFWLAATVATGVVVYVGLCRLDRFGIPVTLLLIISSMIVGWLLWPTICDTHESFFDAPNKRCECRGVSFPYTQSFQTDGTLFDMCVGWNKPITLAKP